MGADAVECHGEGEGPPGEVVGGAGAGESDLVGPEAGRAQDLVEDGHQQVDLGEFVGAPPVRALGEGDDGHVPHLHQLLVGVVVRVGLAGGPVVVDVPGPVAPHGLDAQPHADLVVGDSANASVQGEVGAVEGDVGVYVRDFDVEILRFDVDDAEGGDRAARSDLDLFGGGDPAGGAGPRGGT